VIGERFLMKKFSAMKKKRRQINKEEEDKLVYQFSKASYFLISIHRILGCRRIKWFLFLTKEE